MLSYWFYPNPGATSYENPKVIALLLLGVVLFLSSFLVRAIVRRSQNPVLVRLARSWPSALRWFGGTAVVLTVVRVETIQFLSMRALWIVWGGALLLYFVVQWRIFRFHYYTTQRRAPLQDPRDPYLPRSKKR